MTRLLERYEALIENGELRSDADQLAVVRKLDELQRALEDRERARRPGFLSRVFSHSSHGVPGAYLWGGVGRGKSMLMDLFCECLEIRAKRRVHFHAFMLEIHERIREQRARATGDPIAPVAAAMGKALDCLAFDVMVINNSADAMIMSRLFSKLLIEHKVALVATSNRPPHDLYKDGLNREHFLPFIKLIENQLEVLPLNGPHDYRLERIGGMACWHTPLGEAATAQVRELFFRLTDFAPEDAQHVPSAELDLGGGRKLFVPKSLKGVGVFSFKRLCGEARGAKDYLAIAQNFHTIILVGIPQMAENRRNEAARFVTLIDTLYEHRVKLFATADTSPNELYTGLAGRFEFERTTSRLKEMQSSDYLAAGHGIAASSDQTALG